jgi:hypothetical protein
MLAEIAVPAPGSASISSRPKPRVALVGQGERSEQLLGNCRRGVERGIQIERFADLQLLRQLALLQLDAEHPAQRVALSPWVESEHGDRPPSGSRSPAMHSTDVVLPAPLGPRIPKISPSSIANDTSLTATVSP